MCGGIVSSKMHDKREAEYRAEEDHRTLQRAAEVRNDPNRMKGAAGYHRKKLADMSTVGRQFKEAPPSRDARMPKRAPAKRSMSNGR